MSRDPLIEKVREPFREEGPRGYSAGASYPERRCDGEVGVAEAQVVIEVAQGVVRKLSFSHNDDVSLEKPVSFVGREQKLIGGVCYRDLRSSSNFPPVVQ